MEAKVFVPEGTLTTVLNELMQSYTPVPGWNFPPSSVRKEVARIVAPDGNLVKITIKVKAIANEGDFEEEALDDTQLALF